METVSLRVTNWEASEIDKSSYSVSLKVPRKQELLNLIPHHMRRLQYNIKFVTGILSAVGHSITLCIFRDYNEPRLGIFLTIGKHREKLVQVAMIDANYVALDEASIEYSLSKTAPPKDLEIPAENIQLDPRGGFTGSIDFWMSTSGWHDETAMVFLTFHVNSRYPPKIVNEEEENFSQGISQCEAGKLDISHLFLSDKLSDISVNCQSMRFPAHRLVLSAQVKHFERMLSAQMKESLEGVINMDDMDSATCKELLRFIYQGKVENLSFHVMELYAAADKYGIASLKRICEQYLYNNITPDNALAIYDLSYMHGSMVLAKRSKEVIISNKEKFAPDPETLKTFTCKYPDLVFQLLQMT